MHIGRRVKELIGVVILQQPTGLPPPADRDTVYAADVCCLDVADGVAHHPCAVRLDSVLGQGFTDVIRLGAGSITAKIGINTVLQSFVGKAGSYDVSVII